MKGKRLRDLLLRLVPTDGSAIGNLRLRQLMSDELGQEIDDSTYFGVRDALVEEGILETGRGRGGSVRLAKANSSLSTPPPLELRSPEWQPVSRRAQATSGRKRGRRTESNVKVVSYRHPDRRKNNPEVGMVKAETDPAQPKTRWSYDPHIDPALQFDIGRADVERIIDDALESGDPDAMRGALERLRRMAEPYLNWTGKAERTSFEVDTVSLHVHERIDPASILRAVRARADREKNGGNGLQLGLFSPPFENLPLRDAIEFYKHDRGWSNRLIAGDSLLVMNSLLKKEGMAGQVQMIYIDPPYGIRYGSNFQPFVNKRDVKDRKDEDLTQEPEMIKAFRDTWELGIHSYLTYLRDRLLIARELLHESGSVFVQISDENLHRVRELMDEVFGAGNYVGIIPFVKTSGAGSPSIGTQVLASVCDYLVWYAKDRSKIKYRQLYEQKTALTGDLGAYVLVQGEDGIRRRLTAAERRNGVISGKLFRNDNLTSQTAVEASTFEIKIEGAAYSPRKGGWKTSVRGMRRLIRSRRVSVVGRTPAYVRFLDDFICQPINNVWTDTGVAGFASDKVYAVQTSSKVVERCVLMTTDPGDLVLDPTCGSGTTAFVAEKWGRRWITCDTSRVAVTLAKQRLMTASFDYYELRHPHERLKGGFIYKTVPHITLKSIANNPEIDEIYEEMHPAIEEALGELNDALRVSPPPPFRVQEGGRKGKTVDFRAPKGKKVKLPSGEEAPAGALLEWEVPFDFPEEWPDSARKAFDAFHGARRRMQEAMDRSIAAHADQEVLYDQPQVAKDKKRITGPFTVEAVPFPSVLSLDEARFAGEADASVARSGESSRHHQWRDELLKTGIRGRNGQILRFAELEPLPDTRYLHLTGHLADTGERVVVSFGPEHAALEQRQVELALREAENLRPTVRMVVFAAFVFDPEAAKDIDEITWPGVTLLKAQMNPDLLTEDLKKARSTNESFWLMGQPDLEVRKRKDGRYEVEVHGFDYFDTVTGKVESGGKNKIAMWLLDTDYDERSLFPHQVFFPMAGSKDGWMKLRKDIRAELDESLLAEYHGTVSLPFEAGENRKIAVKVVDDRGIESLKVIPLS